MLQPWHGRLECIQFGNPRCDGDRVLKQEFVCENKFEEGTVGASSGMCSRAGRWTLRLEAGWMYHRQSSRPFKMSLSPNECKSYPLRVSSVSSAAALLKVGTTLESMEVLLRESKSDYQGKIMVSNNRTRIISRVSKRYGRCAIRRIFTPACCQNETRTYHLYFEMLHMPSTTSLPSAEI